MTWIDYGIVTVVSFFCLVNGIRGFLYGVLSPIVWFFSFFITSHYYSYLSVWLTGFKSKLIRNGVSASSMFIILFIIGTVIKNKLSQSVKKIDLFGTDKILGLFLGALYGMLIVVIILAFLEIFTGLSRSKDWKESQLIPQFNFIITWFFDYLKIYLPIFLHFKI